MDRTLVVILVGCLGGTLGGVAGQVSEARQLRGHVDDPPATPPVTTSWWDLLEAALLGLVAAAVVPLFLSLAQSHLIGEIVGTPKPGDPDNATENILILAGFCLVAGFSSRSFILGVSSRVLKLAREANEQARQANARSHETRRHVGAMEEVVENLPTSKEEPAGKARAFKRTAHLVAATAPAGLRVMQTAVPTAADYDKPVLAAFHDDPDRRRLAANIAAEVSRPLSSVADSLKRLSGAGLVEPVASSVGLGTFYQLAEAGIALVHQEPAVPDEPAGAPDVQK